MNPIDALAAPTVIPDVTDAGYHEAREILEDHPDTRGMEPSRRDSLAQQLADVVYGAYWSRDEILEQREEAIEAFREIARRRTAAPKYVRDAAPEWVTDILAAEGLTLDAQKAAPPAATQEESPSLAGAA